MNEYGEENRWGEEAEDQAVDFFNPDDVDNIPPSQRQDSFGSPVDNRTDAQPDQAYYPPTPGHSAPSQGYQYHPYPTNVPVNPAVLSQAPPLSQLQLGRMVEVFEGKVLLDRFQLAWIEQDSNTIRLNWTDVLKKYISSCDSKACSDLLVFLITNIKDEANIVYVGEFKTIIQQRKERFNLENIVDEILKIVFENIKANHSYLVKKFSDMMVRQLTTIMLPKEIALQLLATRSLFSHGKFAGLTGLYFNILNNISYKNGVQIKAPAPTRLEIFKKTIHKYLIQTSNQNNLEASGATPVELIAVRSKRRLSDDDSLSKKRLKKNEDAFDLLSPDYLSELYFNSGMSIAGENELGWSDQPFDSFNTDDLSNKQQNSFGPAVDNGTIAHQLKHTIHIQDILAIHIPY